jgi:hypothetical protein
LDTFLDGSGVVNVIGTGWGVLIIMVSQRKGFRPDSKYKVLSERLECQNEVTLISVYCPCEKARSN